MNLNGMWFAVIAVKGIGSLMTLQKVSINIHAILYRHGTYWFKQ